MESYRIKVGVLTSNRADLGIYHSLLLGLENESRFEVEIIAFGSHLSKEHGRTYDEIVATYSLKSHTVKHMPDGDQPNDIATSYGETVKLFSTFWTQNTYDWIICLGDRFEMSAAVQATIPFNLKVAHLHGGETTVGAIDNIYRHQISLACTRHFVATEDFAKRVHEITQSAHISVVGALSIENIKALPIPSWHTVQSRFQTPSEDFVMVTIHPETVSKKDNQEFAKQFFSALEELSNEISILITSTNSDTYSSYFKDGIIDLKNRFPEKIFVQKSLGKLNYFRAVSEAKALLGNSSSAIIEAASFGTWAVNVGKRQLGRPQSGNIINVDFNSQQIIDATRIVIEKKPFRGFNIYWKGNTAQTIIKKLLHA
jgi:GDP/UDP-N,N'-diacetylbacillosamine 2-epimerase (hydrolysing)